jgi:DNA polymerase-3 subunit delta
MSETVPAVHLFLGPEEGQKAEAVEKISATLAARNGEPPEIHRFYAFESRMPEILTALTNKSLFARHRLVIVACAEDIDRRDDIEACVRYIKSPVSDATLILTSTVLSRDINRGILQAVPKDNQRVFWEMFENQKSGWIVNFFRQRKITVDSVAVDYILEMVENNTRDLRAECERLALFLGSGASVGLESVEQYIYHSKEENVFTLFDQVSARNLASSEEILEKILLSREAEPTQIAGGLLRQFRKLAAFKRLMEENYEPAEAFVKIGMTTKKGQRTYLEGSAKYSGEEIESIILLLIEFDSRFRSIKADLHSMLLHVMIYYIAARGGHGAWRLSL